MPQDKELHEQPAAPVQRPREALPEQKESLEKKEAIEGSQPETGETLRQKIEAMDIDDGLKPQASQTASDLKTAAPQEKINKLLLIAKEKGVAYAVSVAKKMGDPYVLDMLHDALAREGLYKQFKE